MNIKKLIEALDGLDNKEREVYIFFNDDIYHIDLIDDSITDRLDINIVGVEKNDSKPIKTDRFHIVIEGKGEDKMRALFEEIQNKYSFYDNCVLDSDVQGEDTIVDDDRREETGNLEV